MSEEFYLVSFSRLNEELEIASHAMLLDFVGFHRGESVKADLFWFYSCLDEQSLQSTSEPLNNDCDIVKINHNVSVERCVFLLLDLKSLLDGGDTRFFHLAVFTPESNFSFKD